MFSKQDRESQPGDNACRHSYSGDHRKNIHAPNRLDPKDMELRSSEPNGKTRCSCESSTPEKRTVRGAGMLICKLHSLF